MQLERNCLATCRTRCTELRHVTGQLTYHCTWTGHIAGRIIASRLTSPLKWLLSQEFRRIFNNGIPRST